MFLEKTLESPLDCKEIQPVHSEDQPWDFFGRNGAKVETPVLWPPHAKELTHWKSLWCWEGLGAGWEGDDRGWDSWMPSLTRWTWVSVNSGSWWWTGRPGMLRFMGSQRVGQDWVTDLIWSDSYCLQFLSSCLLWNSFMSGFKPLSHRNYAFQDHQWCNCSKSNGHYAVITILICHKHFLWLITQPNPITKYFPQNATIHSIFLFFSHILLAISRVCLLNSSSPKDST